MKPTLRLLPGIFLLCSAAASFADYPAEVLADNPVAYWRLDDVDGTNIADSSGNGHHGAVDGFENSITFGQTGLLPSETANGSITLAGNDRILVPGFDKIGPGGHTTEYWVNVTQYPAACCDSLVSDGQPGGDFFMMNYLIGPGQGDNGAIRPHFSFGNTPVSITTTPPNVLVLHSTYHVVTTWDPVAGTGNVYFNGQLVLSLPVTANPPTAAQNAYDIYIGRDGRENRPSNFKIDEIALYDFALTPERIAAHYAAGTGGITPPTNYEEEVLFDSPLAYWRLGDSDGPGTLDASGNGLTATADDEVSFGEVSLIPPDGNPAIRLPANTGVVSPGFVKSGTGTTLDFWVKFNAAPAGGAFTNLVGDGEAAGDFHLVVQAGGAGIIRAIVQTDAGAISIDSSESLLDERMHHVVATWEAATGDFFLYIDKVEVASANQSGAAVNGDNPIFIGRDGIEPGLFDGFIDEVAVYDFPLAPDRVAARYNRVDVPPPPPPPVVNGAYAQLVLSDGPVAYWRLGEADGAEVFDTSGNNHHGAQDGGANSITFGGPSLVPAEAGNGSISLAGFDRLLFPGFDKIGAAGYTAEYWVKVTAYPDACCDNLVGDGQPSGDFFMMNYLIGPGQGDNGAIRPHFSFGNTPVSLTTTPPNVLELDRVYHVVTTWDTAAGAGNVYFDGQLVLSAPVTANPPSAAQNAYPIYIGRDGRENRPSNFMIDEVAMYDYPLTAEQILNHYNVGINPEPVRVVITEFSRDAGTGELSISWESKGGKLYNLRSQVDPSSADPIDWPIFDGNGNLAATPPENTLTFPLPADGQRFFVIEEFNAPPVSLFSDDFESGQGGWTVGSEGAAGTDWQLGTPSGVGPPASNSGLNCFATNRGADYAENANVWLRSPALDLTSAGSATLKFAQFKEIEVTFDFGTVSVLDAADDSLITEMETGIDGTSFAWEQFSAALPAAALGKNIKIEFRFQSDGFGQFAGWYIDDVLVTVP